MRNSIFDSISQFYNFVIRPYFGRKKLPVRSDGTSSSGQAQLWADPVPVEYRQISLSFYKFLKTSDLRKLIEIIFESNLESKVLSQFTFFCLSDFRLSQVDLVLRSVVPRISGRSLIFSNKADVKGS